LTSTLSTDGYLRFLDEKRHVNFAEIATRESVLAQRLGLTLRQLRVMRRRGLTPIGYKIGRIVYFRNDDVSTWLLRMPLTI
jgi:hypothetical protein